MLCKDEKDLRVLVGVVAGLNNTQIARNNDKARGWAAKRVGHMMRRVGVKSRMQLAIEAWRRGVRP